MEGRQPKAKHEKKNLHCYCPFMLIPATPWLPDFEYIGLQEPISSQVQWSGMGYELYCLWTSMKISDLTGEWITVLVFSVICVRHQVQAIPQEDLPKTLGEFSSEVSQYVCSDRIKGLFRMTSWGVWSNLLLQTGSASRTDQVAQDFRVTE